MSFWTAFTYNTGWSDYGSPFQGGAFKIDGDRVWFRGVITQTGLSGTFPFTIATLPANCVPPAKVALTANESEASDTMGVGIRLARLGVDTSGNLLIDGQNLPSSGSGYPCLCLDGLSYSILS
jgi:hypothetical protein